MDHGPSQRLLAYRGIACPARGAPLVADSGSPTRRGQTCRTVPATRTAGRHDVPGCTDKDRPDIHPHGDTPRTLQITFATYVASEFTIDDPKAYTRPWSVAMWFELMPDTDLLEDVCENDKWGSTRGRPR
jgi:hypothetical protein